jgi:hypothetical protein
MINTSVFIFLNAVQTVNLDRHTGFVKGYALVEFAEKKQAQEALEECNGSEVSTLGTLLS